MKKLIALFLLCSPLFANEYLKITSTEKNKKLEYHNHETYESWYDIEYKNPAFVIWDLTFEEAKDSDDASGNRSSSFKKCMSSATQDVYAKTDYDRGHMCPNNDRDWSKEAAAVTFKMCNIAPQTSKLNRGSWQKYEKRGHELAYKHMLVTIACGPIYNNSNEYIGDVRVPDRFFKIFVVNRKIIEAYIFNKNGGDPIHVSEKEIERVAKIKFEVK